uniref:Ig-like domain-containing protein n=1 Tax=Pygocentrus nattereri TaxID=42514 RepID=A0AAR2KTN3_PYGNA
MRDLQSGDTGMYWCAVEIGGKSKPDVKEDFYITVKSDPDLSVVESSVSGQEGGSVSVQCLYSAGYQNEQKQWWRSKDQRCYTVGRTDTSQNSAVQISDDGRRSFSVEMSGLQQSDAGWYWCKTGYLQIPVHLSVSDAPPGSTTVTRMTETELTTNASSAVTTSENINHTDNNRMEQDKNGEIWLVGVLLAVGLGLLLILLGIIMCTLRKKHKSRGRCYNTAVLMPSSAPDQSDVTYISVRKVTKNETLRPTFGDEGVIYSSLSDK